MRKALLLVSLLFQTAIAGQMTKEEFLTQPMDVWTKAYSQFLFCSSKFKENYDFEPKVIGRLKSFSKVANSYGISIEELQNSYNFAVKRAAEEVLVLLSKRAKEMVGDEDVAFLMVDLPEYTILNFGSFIHDFAKENSQKFLQNSLKNCLGLKYSPMIRAFVRSSDCRELLKQFPDDVKSLVYLRLSNLQNRILKNPEFCKKSELKFVIKNLRKFGFAN